MSECPFLPTASTDPHVSQLSEQILALQRFIKSPTNLINIINNPTSPALIADEVWIHKATVGLQLKLSHIGPSTEAISIDPIQLLAIVDDTGNKYLELDTNPVKFDAKGHEISVDDSETHRVLLTPITVITTVVIGTTAVQVKTQDVFVLANGSESSLTTVATITQCSGSTIDGGSP